MLEVRLIGTFAIRCDGKPVTLSSRAAQSLFAYLILTAGILHRREKLAGMFWPEETEEKARAYLRNELWRIRKVLSHTSNVEYLLVDSLTIGFDQASAYWLDVTIHKNLSDKGTADELVNSLSLYQGELLPGFYEDWVVLEREYLQSIYETKISRLMELLESEKRWHEILDWAD
jgi:DNA-binding SARP family transcriptional activator